MVELQIVVLVVAGSSPVGHPFSILRFGIADLGSVPVHGMVGAKYQFMIPTADFLDPSELRSAPAALRKRILNGEELCELDNLEKLRAGCDITLGRDARDLIAA